MSFSDSSIHELGIFFPALMLTLLVAMWSISRVAGKRGRPVDRGRGATLAAIYVCMYLAFALPSAVSFFSLLLLAILGGREWLRATKSHGFAWQSSGLLWVVAGFFAFAVLRVQPQGAALCVFAFFLINISDTAAYFCGKLFGKTKLAPSISPGKTVEGSIGVIPVTIALAALFEYALGLEFSLPLLLFFAVAISFFAQLGDLLASLAKRRLGIKDFGTILPGHGGILDRFDSSLAAGPAFCFIYLLSR